MKLIVVLTLAACINASATAFAQKVNLNVENVSLEKVFSLIKAQTGYKFFYEKNTFQNTSGVTLHVKNASIADVLNFCFKNKPFSFIILHNTIGIKRKDVIPASSSVAIIQPIVITGKVTDSLGNPIAGTSVVIKGKTIGTVTNAKGEFQIAAKPGDLLQFNFIGYKPKEVVVGDKTEIDVQLSVEISSISDLVVIGYGTQKKSDLTGAISTISGDEIKQIPVTTAAEAITGKIPGVNVVTQSGAPGATVNVVVRGGTSITQSITPLYIIDGFESGDLTSVDVNDIESITVLKDASATAIYGSRGSNGVIVITTKSGKAGKTQVSFGSYVDVQKLVNPLKMMNAEQFVDYQYEYDLLNGNPAEFAEYYGGNVNDADFYSGSAQYIKDTYGSNPGIDWQKMVFGGNAIMQNHSISVSGGDEKTRFTLNGNFMNEDGILSKHGYQKYNLRFQISHNINRNVSVDFNANYNNAKTDGGGSLGGALRMTILQPPTGGVRFTDAQLINTDLTDSFRTTDPTYDAYNPIIFNNAINDVSNAHNFTANAGLNIKILKDFTWRSQASYSWTQTLGTLWNEGVTADAIEAYGGPYASISNKNSNSWQILNTLTYQKKIGLHRITAMAGQQLNSSNSYTTSSLYDGFPAYNFGLNNLAMATTVYSYSSSAGTSKTASAFGRIIYSYDDKYLFTGTLRGDGVSVFAEGHQWGIFPSMSAAWKLSEEKFIRNLHFFDQLKLRVGYGMTGNSNISNYTYVTSYSAGYYAINRSVVSTLVPGSVLANPDVKWEKTATTDIGLDMSVFNDRLSITADYYNNRSNNLLMSADIPTSTGYTTQYQNIGAIRNRGFEFSFESKNIRGKDFSWNTNFNINFNRSKVLQLVNGNSTYYSGSFIVQVGKPMGQFYGYKYAGIYTTDDFSQNADGSYTINSGVPYQEGNAGVAKPGDIKFKPTKGNTDANGNPVWSTSDETVIGNASPKFTGGITNDFRYKGFDLSIFMNFIYGNEIYDENNERFYGPRLPNQNALAVMADRFRLVDPETGLVTTDLSRLAAMNPNQHNPKAVWSVNPNNNYNSTSVFSDYYLENGSFLRVNTITLGYTIPNSVIKKKYIRDIRLYATVHNLHNFTSYKGYDPEVATSNGPLGSGVDNSAYPRNKSYILGLNINF